MGQEQYSRSVSVYPEKAIMKEGEYETKFTDRDYFSNALHKPKWSSNLHNQGFSVCRFLSALIYWHLVMFLIGPTFQIIYDTYQFCMTKS